MGQVASDCFRGKDPKDGEARATGAGGKSVAFGYRKGFRSEYRLGKELGRGQFGTTYMCEPCKTWLLDQNGNRIR